MSPKVERRLFLTSVPDDFDPSRDVALSPACFVGREDRFPDWSTLPFIDAFPTHQAFYQAGETIRELTEAQIVLLGQEMNTRWKVDHGYQYWYLLSFTWLFRLAEVAYLRYRLMEATVARYGHEAFSVTIAAETGSWNFIDMKDFVMRGIAHPDFIYWLDSLFLEHLAPAPWSLRRVAFSPPVQGRTRDLPPPRVRWLRQLARKLMPRIRFDNVWGVGPVGRLLFSLFLSLAPSRPPVEAAWVGEAQSRPMPVLPAAFLSVLQRLIEVARPGHLRDAYAIWEAEAVALPYAPGRLQVGPVTWINERELFLAAHAAERGEKLVSSQYGCHYGTALVVPFFAGFLYRFHTFLTWGWTAQEDHQGHFVAAPSPYLSSIADRHREKNTDLVLVGTSLHAVMTRLHSGPQLAQSATYREWKRRFLAALPAATRDQLIYRPHHLGDWDLQDMSFVRRLWPEIRELKGDQFELARRLLECRLLVLDNPGTTMHIAMAANIPWVGFWDKDSWQLCRQSTPLFQAMEQVGIVHHDPEAAAAHVAALADGVSAWWNAPAVQQVRQAFCANHGLTSRNWSWHWLRLLWRLNLNP
ncbi:MAG: LIC12162 family protein [Magnetospirillum sp.]|nr:LIC12162 family protein [Magnetospirillum sp.]